VQLGRLRPLCGWWPLITMALLLAALSPMQAAAVELPKAIERVPSDPIPKEGYVSWSLFLVCNSAWLRLEKQRNLQDLYVEFQAFGRAIGPTHLAIWFWESSLPTRLLPPENVPALSEYIDVNRSSRYCARFGLLPSKSPHVLVTTIHPDDPRAIVGNKVILELDGTTSLDTQILLLKLADQLVVQGLNQAELDSEAYWRTWRRGLESTYAALANLLQHVKFTVDVKFFKVEIGGEPKVK
jgi:hypothetical protein